MSWNHQKPRGDNSPNAPAFPALPGQQAIHRARNIHKYPSTRLPERRLFFCRDRTGKDRRFVTLRLEGCYFKTPLNSPQRAFAVYMCTHLIYTIDNDLKAPVYLHPRTSSSLIRELMSTGRGGRGSTTPPWDTSID